MIKESAVTPKPQTPTAKRLFYTLLLLALTTIAVASFATRYRGIIGFCTVLLVTAMLFVFNGYMAGEFRYEVFFDRSGTACFLVMKTVGKKRTTLISFELADIKKVSYETPEEQKAHKRPYGVKKYAYCPTLGNVPRIRLSVATRYESAEVLLEGGEEYANMLDSYAKEARLLRSNEIDD